MWRPLLLRTLLTEPNSKALLRVARASPQRCLSEPAPWRKSCR